MQPSNPFARIPSPTRNHLRIRNHLRHLLLLFGGFVFLLLFSPTISTALFDPPTGYWYQVRAIEAADLGLVHPVGLTYSPSANRFFAIESGETALAAFTPYEDRVGANELAAAVAQPLNAAFYDPSAELIALDPQGQTLAQAPIGPRGDRPLSAQAIRRSNAALLRLVNPQGMAFDAAGGRLFILEANGPSLLQVQADSQQSFAIEPAGQEGRIQRTQLHPLRGGDLRGIAFNPANGHLYVSSAAEQKIYELTAGGQIVAVLDLAELNLRDPQGMVFAPSADKTDDPGIYNLYLADSGLSSENPNQGQIIEISFQQPVFPLAVNAAATLVNIIDTSKPAWNPSSPDPAGVAYNPANNRLLISDSEVEEEHPDYQGSNVFQSTLSGTLGPTCSTTSFSNEPTGAAINPANSHIFFSYDNYKRVF
jgi:DNA-binding beta-propeller fold protein YncE